MANETVQPSNGGATDTTHGNLDACTGVPNEPLNDASGDPIECDILVVGAGLTGISAIHRFRKIGMNVKCFESGSEFGGVWHWNRYPGARVDSECPFYQLNIPEVYRDWHFTQRFPDHRELRRYVAHVDKVLHLSKDTLFNAKVVDASWDRTANAWTVRSQAGQIARAKYLMLATGLLHREHVPKFPGMRRYKGDMRHATSWSEDYISRGKRIGIIGAGATAVQMTERFGKDADHLTILLRRPSYCLPMRQRKLTREEQTSLKAFYPALFKAGRESLSGFPTARQTLGALDATEKERESYYEDLWQRGAFNFSLCNFNNIFLDKRANKIAYDFWRRKVCARLKDPAKQRIMAPEVAPVTVHDLRAAPLESFHEHGIITADGVLHEFDAVVLATGFDSYTGSLTNMGLKNRDGIELADLWADGISTYLGITMSGFPNTFMAYTPQAPTALSNGTTLIEVQVEVIADMIAKLESEGAKNIEPRREAEEDWAELLAAMSECTLIPSTDSWWNAGNIPGKRAQHLIYVWGIQMYEKQLRETLGGWKGFNVVSEAKSANGIK